eukprot:jgi/Chrzof1/11948/Cz06g15200.t1
MSSHQLVLAVLANGLMVPRALCQGELMWFTGTSCGAMLATAQYIMMLSLGSCPLQIARSAAPALCAVLLLICFKLLTTGWDFIAITVTSPMKHPAVLYTQT